MPGLPGDPTRGKKIDKPFVPMERDFEHHRFWPTQTGETFIKAIAFEDLWLKTEIGPRVRYVEGVRVELGPGQCIVDERTLARRWKWSRGRVRRFLNDLSMGGEAALERYHWGTKVTLHKQVTWWGDGTTDGTANDTGDSTTESPGTVPPSIPRPRDCETTPGAAVDNSVDNPSMARMVGEVFEAFAAAAGIVSKCDGKLIPNRAICASERVHIERALRTGVDSHVLAEYVREKTAEGARTSTSPIGTANYALTAWWRERAAPKPRKPQRTEPKERPHKPACQGTATPLPRRELTDEEDEKIGGSIRGILEKLGLPSTGGKK